MRSDEGRATSMPKRDTEPHVVKGTVPDQYGHVFKSWLCHGVLGQGGVLLQGGQNVRGAPTQGHKLTCGIHKRWTNPKTVTLFTQT